MQTARFMFDHVAEVARRAGVPIHACLRDPCPTCARQRAIAQRSFEEDLPTPQRARKADDYPQGYTGRPKSVIKHLRVAEMTPEEVEFRRELERERYARRAAQRGER